MTAAQIVTIAAGKRKDGDDGKAAALVCVPLMKDSISMMAGCLISSEEAHLAV